MGSIILTVACGGIRILRACKGFIILTDNDGSPYTTRLIDGACEGFKILKEWTDN